MPGDYTDSIVSQSLWGFLHGSPVKFFTFSVSAAIINFMPFQLFQRTGMLQIDLCGVLSTIAVDIRSGGEWGKYLIFSGCIAQLTDEFYVADNRRIAFPAAFTAAGDMDVIGTGWILIKRSTTERFNSPRRRPVERQNETRSACVCSLKCRSRKTSFRLRLISFRQRLAVFMSSSPVRYPYSFARALTSSFCVYGDNDLRVFIHSCIYGWHSSRVLHPCVLLHHFTK